MVTDHARAHLHDAIVAWLVANRPLDGDLAAEVATASLELVFHLFPDIEVEPWLYAELAPGEPVAFRVWRPEEQAVTHWRIAARTAPVEGRPPQ